jgi:aldehyde dehydrogenase (NAD+)
MADLQCTDPNDRARSRLSEVENWLARAAESFTVGDPFAENTRLGGPLISAAQRDRVRC